jgi:hypothetical protein
MIPQLVFFHPSDVFDISPNGNLINPTFHVEDVCKASFEDIGSYCSNPHYIKALR